MNDKADDFIKVNHPIGGGSLLIFIVAQIATFQSTPSLIAFCIYVKKEKGEMHESIDQGNSA